jgi:hypothetical protein
MLAPERHLRAGVGIAGRIERVGGGAARQAEPPCPFFGVAATPAFDSSVVAIAA